MTKFDVKVRPTSITVYPGLEAIEHLTPLLNLLTYEDEFQEETKTLGYIYDEDQDLLYLHKGVDVNYLSRLLENTHIEYSPADPMKSMQFEYDEIVPPRNAEQTDCINFIAGIHQHSENIDDNQIFLVKNPGFGKAEPYSRKIPTVNGFTRMGDLKVGDTVFDRRGYPTTVTDIFEQGVQDVYKVTFSDNRVAYCVKKHLWTIIDPEYKSFRTLTLDEIIDNWIPNYYKIPMCDPVQYPKRDIDIEPWCLGTFIALGLFDEEYLTLRMIDEVHNRIVAQFAGYLGYEVKYNIEVDNVTATFFKNGSLVKTDDFIKDAKSVITDHKIPDNYMFNDPVIRSSLLYGLSSKYSFMPDDMIPQYLQLLYSLGGSTDEDSSDEHALTIKMIEFSHREECRCIMVNNEEHLYLTEDYIVTHNTFCSGVGLCKYGYKTLIIMHRDSLRKQWLGSLYKMCGLSDDEVHEISDSQELYDIAHDNHEFDYDVYLMTHATFRAGLKRIGNLKDAANITKNLGIGLKIIDEAHLEFRDTLIMDFVFNVKRNLYLTATDGRSTKAENSIFRHVFSNATFYKPSTLLTSNQPSKWVEYIITKVNTHAKPNIVRFRVEGGRGMNPATYGKWVIAYDNKKTHFKCCRDLLKIIYERDQNAKVLLFMPLIDLCTDCSYFLTKNLNYDDSFKYDLTIRTINSSNTKAENEENKHADVIVTTIASCGTGTDIPGITDIINCSPFVSHVTAKQVFGRIRYCGKQCHFYDVYDDSVRMDRYWIKSRSKVMKNLATKTDYLEWVDDSESSDK